MTYPTLLQWLPLATAIVWFGLTIYQVYRDRYRTWTEVFFLGTTFFIAAYALSDLYFFNAPTMQQAAVAAHASFSSVVLAALFFLLFGLVFYTRMRKSLFLLAIPPLIILPWLWTSLVEGFEPLDPIPGVPDLLQPGPYVGHWDDLVFSVFGIYILAYTITGAITFFLTYRQVMAQTKKLRGRMRGLMITFVLTIALGASTNLIRGIVGFRILPLFSTALVLPGLVAFVTLSPAAKERLSIAVRRWKSRHYSIKVAFLTYEDGTLIGSKVGPGEDLVDRDLLSATLDVIQNFMRTSFPGLRGKWLRSITHGEYILVMEHGRRAYLTLLLTGEETDQLRRQMRDLLLAWEGDNRAVLEDWRGLPEEALGTEEFLGEFFVERSPDGREVGSLT